MKAVLPDPTDLRPRSVQLCWGAAATDRNWEQGRTALPNGILDRETVAAKRVLAAHVTAA